MKYGDLYGVTKTVEQLKACQYDIQTICNTPHLIQVSISASRHFQGEVKQAAMAGMLKQLRENEARLISQLTAFGVTGVYRYEAK